MFIEIWGEIVCKRLWKLKSFKKQIVKTWTESGNFYWGERQLGLLWIKVTELATKISKINKFKSKIEKFINSLFASIINVA